MILIQTDDGKILQLAEDVLLAARVSVRWDNGNDTLQVVIRFADSNLPGQTMIQCAIDGSDYLVSVRQKPSEDNSVLARANRLRERIAGWKPDGQLLDLEQ